MSTSDRKPDTRPRSAIELEELKYQMYLPKDETDSDVTQPLGPRAAGDYHRSSDLLGMNRTPSPFTTPHEGSTERIAPPEGYEKPSRYAGLSARGWCIFTAVLLVLCACLIAAVMVILVLFGPLGPSSAPDKNAGLTTLRPKTSPTKSTPESTFSTKPSEGSITPSTMTSPASSSSSPKPSSSSISTSSSSPIVTTSAPPISVVGNKTMPIDVAPSAFLYFTAEFAESTDFALKLDKTSDEIKAVLYARQGAPPNHVDYDVMTKTGTRSKRDVQTQTGATLLLKNLGPGKWFFGFFNGAEKKLATKSSFGFNTAPKRCPGDCSTRGTCVDGTCKCNTGWGGDDCSTVLPVPCIPKNCSFHGVYTTAGCVCFAGWKGQDCDLPDCIPSNCNFHGDCRNGQCACSDGWKGKGCGKVACIPADCNNNGICTPGTRQCVCQDEWQGSDCGTKYKPCPSGCSGHGTCNNVTGVCTCSGKWTSKDCSLLRCDDCSSHGSCKNGTCECKSGWTGPTCMSRTCEVGCEGNGRCDNGTCICNKGWSGSACLEDTCPKNCHNNGLCIKNSEGNWHCTCEPGFRGIGCQIGTETSCSDNIDNDKDNLVDCDDPDCCNMTVCETDPSCGFSPEPEDFVKTNHSTTQPFYDQVSFLFEESGIQQDFNISVFSRERIAVLRGKVFSRNTSPLIGVTVAVLGQPLYGYTMTRKDGSYDMAINGGGVAVVTFRRRNFIGSQRAVSTNVLAYLPVPDVAMLPVDEKVTMVPMNSTKVEVAEGNEVEDEDGKRKGVVMFFPGTTTTVVSNNGSENVTVENPHLRITEYTVGDNGEQAMPAELPPSTGYTYAVELSVDEASVNGSTDVVFNKPVAYYVNGYIDFPVGSAVPTGFYNRSLGEWVTSANGRVVQILNSSSSSLAQLDVDGSGKPASIKERQQLNITDEELERLAGLYPAGSRLWRILINHFTPYDCNWPYGPPDDGCGPADCDDLPEPDDDPCKGSGGPGGAGGAPGGGGGKGAGSRKKRDVIEIRGGDDPAPIVEKVEKTPAAAVEGRYKRHEKQQSWFGSPSRQKREAEKPVPPFGGDTCPVSGVSCGKMYTNDIATLNPADMSLTIPGTSIPLVYNYRRQPGYKTLIRVPVSGPNLAASAKALYVEIQVAGNNIKKKFAPQENLRYTHIWNKKDSYGRMVQGRVKAKTRIGYEYGLVYYAVPSRFSASFNRFSNANTQVAVRRGSRKAVFWTERESMVEANILPNVGLGGWTIAMHHSYDANSATLYLGTGEKFKFADQTNIIRTVVGDGKMANENCQACGEAEDGTEASMTAPMALAAGPDGSTFIGDFRFIRRRWPDGRVTTVLKLPIRPRYKYYMACNPKDGSLFLSDPNTRRVYRIDTSERGDGQPEMEVVAGTGEECPPWELQCGDEGPARDATFSLLKGIAIGKDGNVFVIDDRRVRVLGNDGGIDNYVGTNSIDFTSLKKVSEMYSLPMSDARFVNPSAIAVDPGDESLYITDEHVLLKLSRNGVMKVVAGRPVYKPPVYKREGLYATETDLDKPDSVAVTTTGKVYIAETDTNRNNKIHELLPNGFMRRLAGRRMPCDCSRSNCNCFQGDGLKSGRAVMYHPSSLAIGTDSSVLVADQGNRRIRAITIAVPQPSVGFGEYAIPDPQPNYVYIFDRQGRHLRTLDSATKAIILRFGYTEDGFLKSMTDISNRTMNIERRSDGSLHAFRAPSGDRTVVTLDKDGMLSNIADPEARITRFNYDSGGLMTGHKAPFACSQTFKYSDTGRLESIDRGQGVVQTFKKEIFPFGSIESHNSMAGRKNSIERQQEGSEITTTVTGGLISSKVKYSPEDGTTEETWPDGTKVRTETSPHPIWGAQIQVVSRLSLTTPSGKTKVMDYEHEASLTHQNNPLTATKIAKTIKVNNRPVYTTEENFSTKTITDFKYNGKTKVMVAQKFMDDDGRIIRRTNPADGRAEMSIQYDDLGNIMEVKQGTSSVKYKYNSDGLPIEEERYGGQKISYEYNGDRQVSAFVLASGRRYGFQHNNCSRLSVLVMPNGAKHAFRTNIRRHMRDEVYQSSTSRTFSMMSTYGLDGDLQQLSYPTNNSIVYKADESMRPKSISFGSEEVQFAYSGNTDKLREITRFSAGNRDSTITMTYDGSLLTGMEQLHNPNSLEPEVTLQYKHNNDFMATGMSGVIFGRPLTMPVTYNTMGEVESYGLLKYTSPAKRQNKVTHEKMSCITSENTIGLIETKDCVFNNKKIYSLKLERSGQNRITKKTVQVGDDIATYEYAYDADGQLIETKKNGQAVESYSYNQNGNRVQWTSPSSSGSKVSTAFYTTDDQLKRVESNGVKTSYLYDANGFVRKRGSQTLHYNLRGELMSAKLNDQTVRYRYDAFGRRIEMKTSIGNRITRDIRYVYAGTYGASRPTHIMVNGDDLLTLYYDKQGHLMAMDTPSGMRYIMTDMVGTPVAMFGSYGNLLRKLEHDSYGVLLSDDDIFIPIGFAGGLHDLDTGLVHFLFRDYDPTVGKWLSRDPALFGSNQPNLYQYVFNDPINFNDPLGLWGVTIGGSIFALFGGGGSLTLSTEGVKVCGELGVGTPGASVGFEFGEGVTSGPEGGSFEVGAEIGAKIENPLIEAGASASSSVNIYDPEKGGDPCENLADRLSTKAGGKGCVLGGYACVKGGFTQDSTGTKIDTPTFERDYAGIKNALKAENLKFKASAGAKITGKGCYSKSW